MFDLIIYAALVLGLIWDGWAEHRPFDYLHAERISQEEGTNGSPN